MLCHEVGRTIAPKRQQPALVDRVRLSVEDPEPDAIVVPHPVASSLGLSGRVEPEIAWLKILDTARWTFYVLLVLRLVPICGTVHPVGRSECSFEWRGGWDLGYVVYFRDGRMRRASAGKVRSYARDP